MPNRVQPGPQASDERNQQPSLQCGAGFFCISSPLYASQKEVNQT